MDVSITNTITIDSLKVHKVPLEAHGPIGRGLSALLLGRSNATLQGIFVHPGVIDADYMGPICAIVSTPTPPMTIPAWDAIPNYDTCYLGHFDCRFERLFFTIPLHPDDIPKFAFIVPSVNHAAPVECYQWKNPDEVGKYLEENCHDDSKEKKLIAISWALAYAYCTLLDTVEQQIEAGKQGDKSVTQAAANPTATQAAAKPDCEAKTPAVAAVKKGKKGKKHMCKTNRPVDNDPGEGPSMPPDTQSEAEPTDTQLETEPTGTKSEAQPTGPRSGTQPTGTISVSQPAATRSGATIESFSLKDLRGLRKDYTRQLDEAIISCPLVTFSFASIMYWYKTSLPTSGKVLGTLSLGDMDMLVFLQMPAFDGCLPSACTLLYALFWITISNAFLMAPQLMPWNSNNVWVSLLHALNQT
ncbi:hypothetical protein DUI87_02315 [Hirundo rustica rustica]|uniref:dUTPase-like domain-containing protein n=1 Tax=Hirundo rustica rustica TaxID=333673 RepID=A0A3M0L7G9_HIRRU|nr:hypothetical protein DUI87_02315 [Hirundo rustica rustica]